MPTITQSQLMNDVMPLLLTEQNRFKKCRQVHARLAIENEKIVSITSDSEETINVARAGDKVVKNLTKAEELYIVPAEEFSRLYDPVEELDGGWTLYEPKGEILAIEITQEVMENFNVGESFLIDAPWGSEQTARIGDFFVSPLPEAKKIYRIARVEFEETYRSI